MKITRLICILLASVAGPSVLASTINVPKDQPTIQAGINAANNGDTVLVAPGTYLENIDFKGKAITVTSSKGPKITIIDGSQKDSVVAFVNKETVASVLRGFTIQNGVAKTYGSGGGITMQAYSSATIIGNVIKNNQGCSGGGVYNQGGAPVIQRNVITQNFAACGNGSGGGIELDATYGAHVLNNVIENNSSPSGGGAGITIEGVFQPVLIENNVIRGNYADSQGGGILAYNDDDALVIQNLIVGNSAAEGGGVDWTVVENTTGPTMVNNTFARNTIHQGGGCGYCVREGSAAFLNGFYEKSMLVNNLFIGVNHNSALYCSNDYQSVPPTLITNDAYTQAGVGFASVCVGQNGTNGNISANPRFVNPAKNNYLLRRGSPAINAGTNSAPDLPKKDLAGKPRIVDGIVDMGAYEYQGTGK